MKTLKESIQGRLADSQEVIAKFQQKLSENPAYALSWSGDAFTAAAKITILKDVLGALERGVSEEEISRTLMQMALNGAEFPERSTSPTSNLYHQELTSQYVRIHQAIDRRNR